MKKRFLSALLALAVTAACLTGCGGENKTEDKKEGTTTQATTTTEGTTTTGETTTTTAETTTAEKTTTTASETTTTTAKAPKQEYYEYDVIGVKIKLRTRIEDYISQDAKGNWMIDLEGISNSLGFYYPYYNSDTPPEKRTEFEIALDNGKKMSVLLDDKNSDRQNYRKVVATGNSIGCSVEFARYDISDSSVKTYWIANGGNSAIYKINFQQIVIFTFLEENAKYNIAENWMGSTGIPTTSGGPSYYFVNE